MDLIKSPMMAFPTEGFRICEILSKLDAYIESTYSIEMTEDIEFRRLREFVIYFLKPTGYSDEVNSQIVDYLVMSLLSTKGTLWINNLDLSLLDLDIKEDFVRLRELELGVYLNEMISEDPGAELQVITNAFEFLFFYRKLIYFIDRIVRAISLEENDETNFSIQPMNFLRFSSW